MTQNIPHFSIKDKDGQLAFIIPFYFKSEKGDKKSLCEAYFKEIIKQERQEKQKENGNIKAIYEHYKDLLCDELRNSNSAIFAPHQSIEDENEYCTYCRTKDYQGRNLCDCLSISRRFHDDNSQYMPRLEISLGTYSVGYEENYTQEGAHFNFQMRASLLLNGKKNNECGYLLLSIPFASIDESGFGSATGNKLDNIIFLKHLFYKQRLLCTIKNNNAAEKTSLQRWTDAYLQELFKALKVNYPDALNKYIYKDIERGEEGSAFRYSILELNNIVDEKGNIISLAHVKDMLNTYHKQIYGIMVSDEGWRHTPNNETSNVFEHNYWTSRDFTCTIYLNHNALVINQYDSPECIAYRESATKWMSHYVDVKDGKNSLSFYQDHITLKSCLPGASSLKFDVFLRVIYKEMMIERVQEKAGQQALTESKFKMLEKALQSYSTSIDAIHSAEDIICLQFGIPVALNRLNESYKREANNMQDKRVFDLTVITATISISALLVSFAHIALTALDYKKGFIVTIKHIFEPSFWNTHIEYIVGFTRMLGICIVAIIFVYFVVNLLFKLIWKFLESRRKSK